MNYWGNPNTWGPPSEPKPARIMQLYYCPTCGYWTDKALRDSLEQAAADLGDGIIRALDGTPPEREALPELSCPDGHGVLKSVGRDDRIAVREGTENP